MIRDVTYHKVFFKDADDIVCFLRSGGELYDPVRELPISDEDAIEAFNINLQLYIKECD